MDILNNVRVLWPFLVIPWVLVFACTLWRPQKYMNSVLLVCACFATLFFVAGLFGKYMSYALMVCMILVLLALLLVPLLLIVNGLTVIRKESLSLPHLLSLLLGVVVGIGEIAAVVYLLGTIDYQNYRNLNVLALFVAESVIYFSCLMLNFVVYSVFIQIMPHRMKFDYVIIHGCGLAGGERMTKLLSNRVDKAIEIYHRCEKKPMLIPSGGQGKDEKISEAAAMKAYLLEHGIPEESILMEDQSATTMANLLNSRKLIQERGGSQRTALISSNYHIYRCLSYARKAGLKCVGIGAKVALYFWPSALIREFVAVFKTPKFLIWSLLGYFVLSFPILYVLFSR